MSYSSGVFTINTAGQPVVTGTTITSTAFNLLTADLATGLSTAMLKDGTQTATAGIGFYPGTVSLPGIYFGTDTATGLYRIGLNNTGYTINGTKLLDLSSALVGITGALTVSTTLNVTGATTLSSALNLTDTTQSTSTSTGSIITAGGVGIAKALQVGGTITGLSTFQSSSGADLILNANGANRDIIGKVNGTEVFRLTGSTTTFTVTGPAATSLQAYNATGSTTARVFGTLQNTGGNHTWGVESSAGGQFFGASGAYDSIVQTASGTNLWLGVGTTGIAKVSSTGLAITGTLSSTGAHTAMNATAIPAGGTAGSGYMFSSTANFGVFFGSGAPSLSAAKGSLYLRSDGTTTNDRMYVNTNGSTTWTSLTTAA